MCIPCLGEIISNFKEIYLDKLSYSCEEVTDMLTDLGKKTIKKSFDLRFSNNIETMIEVHILKDDTFQIEKTGLPFECYSDYERNQLKELINNTNFSIYTNFIHNEQENIIGVRKTSKTLNEFINDIETIKFIISNFIDIHGDAVEHKKVRK